MKAFSRSAPALLLGRRCGGPVARRAYSAAPSPAPSVLAAMEAIKTQPAKVIPDYLAPMSSHLLTTTITDLLSSSSPPSSSSSSSPSSAVVSSPPQALPPGHHLVYFPIQLAPSALVPDGADPRHAPGPPFTRRVWAGGELTFGAGTETGAGAGLRLDCRPAVCREDIEGVQLKGKPGDEKVFVDVARRYGVGHDALASRSEWDIEERRTLVFMKEQPASAASSAPPRIIKYPHDAIHSVSLTPNATHLFHFSALSFNAHFIHFDPDWAVNVDGHRALLVHGPFTLTLMLRVLSDHLGAGAAVRRFSYRNHAPLYVNERMTISLRPVSRPGDEQERWDVWVEGPEGGLAVKGTAEIASLSK